MYPFNFMKKVQAPEYLIDAFKEADKVQEEINAIIGDDIVKDAQKEIAKADPLTQKLLKIKYSQETFERVQAKDKEELVILADYMQAIIALGWTKFKYENKGTPYAEAEALYYNNEENLIEIKEK